MTVVTNADQALKNALNSNDHPSLPFSGIPIKDMEQATKNHRHGAGGFLLYEPVAE